MSTSLEEFPLGIRQESTSNGLTLVDKPREIVNRASEAARLLSEIVEKNKLFIEIGKKKHLYIEAWQTIGAFYGATVGIEWTKPLIDKDGNIMGFEARAYCKRNDHILSTVEAMCVNTEANWRDRDLYALRSMAQTRACSKALGMVFRWVPILAGYAGTPAEEMRLAPGWALHFARFNGKCSLCEKDIPKGQRYYYNRELKKARCTECVPSTTEQEIPIEEEDKTDAST